MDAMVTIRIATMDDARAIVEQTAEVQRLHYEAMPGTFRAPHEGLFPPEKLAALLSDANAVVAVAEIGGDVVGHIYGQITHYGSVFRHRESAVYVHQIGVRKDMRGKGIGTALIAFLERRAGELGFGSLGLDHWAFNSSARDFFTARGFAPSQVKLRKEVRTE